MARSYGQSRFASHHFPSFWLGRAELEHIVVPTAYDLDVNSKAKGEISEGLVIAHLLKLGYSISMPFGDNQRYDVIVDDGDRLWRAQVKTGRLRRGCVIFNCVSLNAFTQQRFSYRGQIDMFLVYCPDTEKVYWVPIEKATSSEMWLRVDQPSRKGPHATIKWARDFELVGRKGLEPLTHAL
jgi:hypothetical protein